VRSLIAANQAAPGALHLPNLTPAAITGMTASISSTPPAITIAPLQGKRFGSGAYGTQPVGANALFSGKLGTLQFSQILGLIEPLRLTGALKLFDGVRTGSVHFVEGKVHHAELNEIEGSEALFLLFHLNKGTFQFEVGPPTPLRTVEGNTMSLLL